MDSAVYPSSVMERAMKVKEVILRATDGCLKWYQVAEILGISDACGAVVRLVPQIEPE